MTANITITLMEEKERAIAEGLAEGLARGRNEGLARGINEGLARGRNEGKTEAKIEIAKKLLASGMSIEQVIELTELDLETIKGLLP